MKNSHKIISIIILALSQNIYANLPATNTVSDECHPPVNLRKNQYIIGYGSLMNEKSKHHSSATSGDNIPVYVTGFQRGWYRQTTFPGFNTIFLDVKKQPDVKMAAVAYRLAKPHNITKFDSRESYYCRVKVDPSQVKVLNKKAKVKGEIWIYDSPENVLSAPDAAHPIVQSYVDLFLTGCLELEKKYKLEGFAANCIQSTTNWSGYWLNDRIYPRRPFMYSEHALTIDSLLKQYLPNEFAAIRIE